VFVVSGPSADELSGYRYAAHARRKHHNHTSYWQDIWGEGAKGGEVRCSSLPRSVTRLRERTTFRTWLLTDLLSCTAGVGGVSTPVPCLRCEG
jgi:hypothetical protein